MTTIPTDLDMFIRHIAKDDSRPSKFDKYRTSITPYDVAHVARHAIWNGFGDEHCGISVDFLRRLLDFGQRLDKLELALSINELFDALFAVYSPKDEGKCAEFLLMFMVERAFEHPHQYDAIAGAFKNVYQEKRVIAACSQNAILLRKLLDCTSSFCTRETLSKFYDACMSKSQQFQEAYDELESQFRAHGIQGCVRAICNNTDMLEKLRPIAGTRTRKALVPVPAPAPAPDFSWSFRLVHVINAIIGAKHVVVDTIPQVSTRNHPPSEGRSHIANAY